jgi:hypothetical protein
MPPRMIADDILDVIGSYVPRSRDVQLVIVVPDDEITVHR